MTVGEAAVNARVPLTVCVDAPSPRRAELDVVSPVPTHGMENKDPDHPCNSVLTNGSLDLGAVFKSRSQN